MSHWLCILFCLVPNHSYSIYIQFLIKIFSQFPVKLDPLSTITLPSADVPVTTSSAEGRSLNDRCQTVMCPGTWCLVSGVWCRCCGGKIRFKGQSKGVKIISNWWKFPLSLSLTRSINLFIIYCHGKELYMDLEL